MTRTPRESTKELNVLIAGGGVAALEAALALRELASDRVGVELVAPEPHFWYRPLAVAEPFGVGRAHRFDLGELCQAIGAAFTLSALTSVDTEAHVAETSPGPRFEYDVLLLALGAVSVDSLEGALNFRGPADTDAFGRLLGELEGGAVHRLVFVAPGELTWPLPLYELALLTARRLRARGIEAEISFVTPEHAPLQLFGRAASDAVRGLLDDHGIVVHTGAYSTAFRDGQLTVVPDGTIAADRVVTLPRLRGSPILGIPHDEAGFVPADPYGRVLGVEDVYVAGDLRSFPVKQGGLAAQQADAAAEAIAERAGAPITAQPFDPILRGLLVTGGIPRYLKAGLGGGAGDTSLVDTEPLWWPAGKIVGRYLAPFLAAQAGIELPSRPGTGAVQVEVDLGSWAGSPEVDAPMPRTS